MNGKSAGEPRRFDIEDRLIDFAVAISNIVEKLPNSRIGNHVSGQLIRSGTSAAPNYGEAQSAESRRDFIHKMKICLKVLRETNVWLKFIKKKRLAKAPDQIEIALEECHELMSIFAASIMTAEKKLPK